MKKPTKASPVKQAKTPTQKRAQPKPKRKSPKLTSLFKTLIDAELALIKQIIRESGSKGVLWSSIEKEFPHFTLPSPFMTGSYYEIHAPGRYEINAPIKHAENNGIFSFGPVKGDMDFLIKLNSPAKAKKIANGNTPLQRGVLQADGVLRAK